MTAPLRAGDPIVVDVALGDAQLRHRHRPRPARLARARASPRCGPAPRRRSSPTRRSRGMHLAAAEASLARGRHAGVDASCVPPGEARRASRVLERVCEALIAARIERGDLVVALGGGVIGDLAGFAAAIVRRGLDSCRCRPRCWPRSIPRSAARPRSTRRHGKNLVGAFHQPILVLADTALLDTLPAARVPRRLCRGRQIRPARRRRLLRLAGGQLAGRCSPAVPAREHAIATSCRVEGRDRRARRARDRRARAAQSRPHLRPCARSRGRLLRPAAARRGGRARHGAGVRLLGAPRAAAVEPMPSASTAHLAAVGLPTAVARHCRAARPASIA